MVRLWAVLLLGAVAALAQGPTYYEDVAPILQAKCQLCHRDGDIAPFALNGYDDAVTWSRDIQRVLNQGIMPPWKPVAGYGSFRDCFALTDSEKQTILDWIDNGNPEGDSANAPPQVTNTSDWALGDPDLVLTAPAEFTPARGQDVYRCFVLPDTGLDQLTYLSALDVRPGNRQIVHHVLLFQDTTGTAAAKDGQDGQPGYDCFGGPGIPIDYSNLLQVLDTLGGMGGWAPGQRAHFLPDGVGIQLAAGAKIVMQVHYYPAAGTGPDQTSVGLYFARSDVQKRLYNIPVVNMNFVVPPDTVKDVVATFPPFPLPISAQAISIFPHMHLLGRKIKVDLFDRDGNQTPMIYEDNWEFNWQGAYTFSEPIAVPAGAKIKLTCTFDNTADNPRNPNNPLIPVGWGERTTDEMCLAFVGVTLDNDPFTALKTMKPVR